MKSPLELDRLKYEPKIPAFLNNPNQIVLEEVPFHEPLLEIKEKFPLSSRDPLLKLVVAEKNHPKKMQIGVLFSGGQAAGGHNVVVGLFNTLKKLHPENKLFGFLGGPLGLMTEKYKELHGEELSNYLNQGGFDLLGSGRDKIETEEHYLACQNIVQKLCLDGIIFIGGDDTHTNAACLSEYFLKNGVTCSVIGVPKTIDGDLQNEFVDISFGFDTACKVYAESIGNIARDALSAGKYYFFIKMMGRSASHVTLECALKTHPNLALISEEIAAKKKTFSDVVADIADLVIERKKIGKEFGVILIPEGIVEFMSELSSANWLELDPHGNIQVSKIESERLLIEGVQRELERRNFEGKFLAQPLFLGYEGRSAMPSNFDANYTYALGAVAAVLIVNKKTGYMAALTPLKNEIKEWQAFGVPLAPLLHQEERKGKLQPVIQKTFVDLEGCLFKQFADKRVLWRREDSYLFPGPIQFHGPNELKDTGPLILQKTGNAS